MKLFAQRDLPIINGDKVSLRPITEEDTDLIVRWRNDPAVQRFFIFREPFTRELHLNWMRTRVAAGQVIQYIIMTADEHIAVGSVYYRDIDPSAESAEYGIFIGEEAARGMGLGTETATLFTRFGFDVLGLRRIVLKVLGGNDIARRSYEKAGFKHERTAPAAVTADGEALDVIYMAKFRGED